ncbi:MAG: NfeD family protein [Oscillospiraceae bacterium]|nr:NfeD family protein [Oscillospiraceae bacterium]
MDVIYWLIAVIAFIILEAVTYQLVSVWFVIGSLAGLLAAALGASVMIQVAVFVIVSALMLIILRPLSMKLLKPKGLKTNTDRLIGEDVLITENVSNISGTGKGKISGMTWTVRSESGEDIPENSVATVVRIEGVKLIVKAKS